MGEEYTTFYSREEIALRLFDETVTPGMNYYDRMVLALISAQKAQQLWEEYA
jgi:uncharacterized protein YacL (UPF0231 family)